MVDPVITEAHLHQGHNRFRGGFSIDIKFNAPAFTLVRLTAYLDEHDQKRNMTLERFVGCDGDIGAAVMDLLKTGPDFMHRAYVTRYQ